MEKQVFFMILGGFISASVGAGLFFLQRYLEKGDEQERILFQILKLMTIRPVPSAGGDDFSIAAQLNIAEDAQKQEISSLAIRIKDNELALEILSCGRMSAAKKDTLVQKISAKINTKLLKKING